MNIFDIIKTVLQDVLSAGSIIVSMAVAVISVLLIVFYGKADIKDIVGAKKQKKARKIVLRTSIVTVAVSVVFMGFTVISVYTSLYGKIPNVITDHNDYAKAQITREGFSEPQVIYDVSHDSKDKFGVVYKMMVETEQYEEAKVYGKKDFIQLYVHSSPSPSPSPIFTVTPALKPTVMPTQKYPKQYIDSGASMEAIDIGANIYFRNYFIASLTSKEPILWYCLDMREGKALLLSAYGLETRPYSKWNQNIDWSKMSWM